MIGSQLRQSDARTWTFEAEGFHLDGPQQAKKRVNDSHDDVQYRDLRAKVVNVDGTGPKFVVVVEVRAE